MIRIDNGARLCASTITLKWLAVLEIYA